MPSTSSVMANFQTDSKNAYNFSSYNFENHGLNFSKHIETSDANLASDNWEHSWSNILNRAFWLVGTGELECFNRVNIGEKGHFFKIALKQFQIVCRVFVALLLRKKEWILRFAFSTIAWRAKVGKWKCDHGFSIISFPFNSALRRPSTPFQSTF